jgi:hypothetical protein
MNKISLLLLLFIVSCNKTDQKTDQNLQLFNLNGKINSVQVTTYGVDIRFGEPQKNNNIFNEEILKFNSKGFLISKNGEFENFEYKYDNSNNLIVSIKKSKEGQINIISKNKFNENSQIIEENIVEYGESLIKKYKYEKNKIIISFFDADGKASGGKHIRELSENQNITKVSNYNAKGNLIGEIQFKYDKNGNETEAIFNKEFYSKNMPLIEIINKYDETNKIVGSTTKDENGFLQMESKYSYEYDDKENWIKMIYSEDDKIISITERKISYAE